MGLDWPFKLELERRELHKGLRPLALVPFSWLAAGAHSGGVGTHSIRVLANQSKPKTHITLGRTLGNMGLGIGPAGPDFGIIFWGRRNVDGSTVPEEMMKDRQYYSVRTGKNKMARSIDLPTFVKLFKPAFTYFQYEGFFQEAFGFECVDTNFNPGSLGHDMDGVILLALRKENLWPILEKIDAYSEDDIFDIIELLHDYCSKPTKRDFHSWGECGWHCHEFDKEVGQNEFRTRVNPLLKIYSVGYELSSEGDILTLPESGLDALLEAPLPQIDPDNIESRIEAARVKFRKSRSSIDDRRDAIRDLSDVLEYLRPKIKRVLVSQDESDLFNIANNFGIRHHNGDQKTLYDKPIWYSWMFYYYLATIHAVLRLIAKNRQLTGAKPKTIVAPRK